MVRSLCLLSAATAVVFAQEDRIPSAVAGAAGQEATEDDKQFWFDNRFRRPFPLRSQHKPNLPQTMRTPQMARDAADKLLFGWNQGSEAAILRLMATGAFVEDYTMLSLPVMTQFGDSKWEGDYIQFAEGRHYPFKGYKNVTAYATAMSCMTRDDVNTDKDCCKIGGADNLAAYAGQDSTGARPGVNWWWSDFCQAELFLSTEKTRNRVVETSFTGTSDGFVAEYKYMLNEADCSGYGQFRGFGEEGVAGTYEAEDCYLSGSDAYYAFDPYKGELVGEGNFAAGYDGSPYGFEEPQLVQKYLNPNRYFNKPIASKANWVDPNGRRLLDDSIISYEPVEFDFAIKASVDNYGRFRRLSVYSSAQNFFEYTNEAYTDAKGNSFNADGE